MERRLIEGHSPYEAIVGFSRAVVAGPHVFVAGTAPIPSDGSDPPEGAYDQARVCLQIILTTLLRAGARPDDVVRTRLYLTSADDFRDIARAHAELFAHIRPATTAVVVKELLDPRWRVEIEAQALIPRSGPGNIASAA